MDRYSCHVSSTPSFSSTLLDAIYRSIDEGEDELVVYKETMRKKQHGNIGYKDKEENVMVRRKSLADFVPKARNKENPEIFYSNSSWSSSDSSSGGGFSSSEAEDSVFAVPRNRASSSSCYGLQKPKPVKTKPGLVHQNPKHEGGFEKTKSKALKIYGDLKKAKQPISPGGKLASFLNSLFSTGHEKKEKRERKTKSANASTCSSASSFSKSCLSKAPSSRGKSFSNGAKRSVRFYPVSVIVDEDCQPCGHKSLHEEKSNLKLVKDSRTTINEEVKIYNFEKNWKVGEAAKDLLRNYQKRVELDFDLRSRNYDKNQVFIDEEVEEDFDRVSCSSSDLFELDNLSAIGMERYREELPVYETTHFDTNLAIANGMIL